MNLRLLLFLPAAAASGWLIAGMLPARVSGGRLEKSLKQALTSLTHRDAILSQFRDPGRSSIELAELAAILRTAPDAQLPALKQEVESWSGGTAKEMALALIRSRLPPGDEAGGAERSDVKYRWLATALAEGKLDGQSKSRLSDWASLDPGAAMAAVSKMPAGSVRDAAVEAAALGMAHDFPAQAMEFLVQAGGKNFGMEAARAWYSLAQKDGAGAGRYLKLMTGPQQQSLLGGLAKMVAADAEGLPFTEDEDLHKLWDAARVAPHGPGREELTQAMSVRFPKLPRWLEAVEGSLADGDDRTVLHAASLVRRAETQPEAVIRIMSSWMPRPTAGVLFGGEESTRIAAPEVLPQLCRSGHIAEAVQLLDRVTDRDAWSRSFQAVLPYWMDTDPAAARAAFDKAPLTALERERMQHLPAFLLNR